MRPIRPFPSGNGCWPLKLKIGLEQLVLRGDDILDLGARLRLLKRQGLDEDALIGNRRRSPFQFRQGAVCLGKRLEHRNRLQVHRWR